jgi:aspartate aminotransferase
MPSNKLSQLAETLIGSEIVSLGAAVKEKIKQGDKIYNYTIGDFDSTIFPIPHQLQNEINEAYKNNYTNYPPAEGIVELRKSVIQFIAEREGIHFNENEVLIAAGGRPLIYAAFRAIVDTNDKVIYATPSWNNSHYVHFTQSQHVVIKSEVENNFMPTAAQIKPYLKGATLLALCSPLNPTGTVFTKQELTEICNLVIEENEQRGIEEKKLYLMYDQIYWTLTYGDTIHYNPISINLKMKDYTIFIDGISKAFAATGVRVGWALGPAHVINKMKAINSHVGAWAPMAEQHAVAKYLVQTSAVNEYFLHFKNELNIRLQNIYNGFKQLNSEGFLVNAIAPQAAIYLTVQINLVGKTTSGGNLLQTQKNVTTYILNEAKLAIVPFAIFGADESNSWYRLSVGTCKVEEIDEMINKLRTALNALH